MTTVVRQNIFLTKAKFLKTVAPSSITSSPKEVVYIWYPQWQWVWSILVFRKIYMRVACYILAPRTCYLLLNTNVLQLPSQLAFRRCSSASSFHPLLLLGYVWGAGCPFALLPNQTELRGQSTFLVRLGKPVAVSISDFQKCFPLLLIFCLKTLLLCLSRNKNPWT